jgi:hypothetical protein
MKAWISLPLAVLTALLAACGKDDESKQKANDEQNGIAIVTLFLIPDTFTANEQLACKEFFRKALPSVRYVPRESSFEGFANSAGLQLLRKVMLPAPSRDRGDEVNSFKAKNIERRKIMEAEIRAEFNLESNADFRTAPMSTFILTKKSFQA